MSRLRVCLSMTALLSCHVLSEQQHRCLQVPATVGARRPTYRELEQENARLRSRLQQAGVDPDDSNAAAPAHTAPDSPASSSLPSQQQSPPSHQASPASNPASPAVSDAASSSLPSQEQTRPASPSAPASSPPSLPTPVPGSGDATPAGSTSRDLPELEWKQTWESVCVMTPPHSETNWLYPGAPTPDKPTMVEQWVPELAMPQPFQAQLAQVEAERDHWLGQVIALRSQCQSQRTALRTQQAQLSSQPGKLKVGRRCGLARHSARKTNRNAQVLPKAAALDEPQLACRLHQLEQLQVHRHCYQQQSQQQQQQQQARSWLSAGRCALMSRLRSYLWPLELMHFCQI